MFQYIPSDLVYLSWPYGVNDFANIRDFSRTGSCRIIKGFITLREQSAFTAFGNNDSQEDTLNPKYSSTTGNHMKLKSIYQKDKIHQHKLVFTYLDLKAG